TACSRARYRPDEGGTMPVLIPISIFVFIVFGTVSLYWLLFRPPSAASERLENLRRQGYGDSPAPVVNASRGIKLAEDVAPPINRFAPPSAETSSKLQKKLMHAGYRSPNAPMIYRAIQMISLFGLPALTALVLTAIGYPVSDMLSWLAGAVFAGYITPRI